jgi:pilus assembly protein CpaF
MSFDVILPFLRPTEHLIHDHGVSEIMVNGSTRVFVERQGLVELVPGVSIAERSLQVAVRNIARALGDEINEEKPILDSRLPDGSRVAAIFPPCSVLGTTLTIRKFQSKYFTCDELVRIDSLTTELLVALKEAVENRRKHSHQRRNRHW